MDSRKVLVPILLFSIVLLGACSDIKRPLVIGAKDFAEQQVIAEIVAQTLRAHGIPADVEDVPRDSLDAIGALWVGDIDLYVEYTGSALALVGHPPVHDPAGSLGVAREQLQPFGLACGPLIGFRNDYAVLVRPGSEVVTEPAEISNLADLNRPVKVGMTTDFRNRPVDGYEPLVRRYGLRAEPTMVVKSSPTGKNELYAALLDGDIDIAIGFLTDPEIIDFGLVVLIDDLGFFPSYSAMTLTRAALLERRPEVAHAIEQLEDTVSTTEIREMVAEVANLGADPFAVAAGHLDPKGISDTAGAGGTGRPLAVSIGRLDAQAGQSAKVILALRKTFPRRKIEVRRADDPLAALLEGTVRYALVSGPEFFALDDKAVKKLRGHADGLVPVGFDVMHLLVQPGGHNTRWRNGTRLGVGAAGGVSARTAALFEAGIAPSEVELVTSEEKGPAAFRAQAELLRAGSIDGLLVMAEPGHPMIAELLTEGLELAPIEIWESRGNRVAFPFLQPVTIASMTYDGQAERLKTFGSQVVLAAASPDPTDAVGLVGPGSAAIGKTLPVGIGTVARIREALKTEVRLDPSLPVALAARRPPLERPSGITPSPFASFVNMVVIVGLVVFVWRYVANGAGPDTSRPGGRRSSHP